MNVIETRDFYSEFTHELKKNYTNYYLDNVDTWYYEAAMNAPYKISVIKKIKRIIKLLRLKISNLFLTDEKFQRRLAKCNYIEKLKMLNQYDFEFLYNNLAKKTDKEFLLKILCFKVYGAEKVKLSNTELYNKRIQIAKNICNFNDYITVSNYDPYKLYKTSLRPYFDAEIYTTPNGYVQLIYNKAYDFERSGDKIGVEPGDVVLDCGGYSLDSAIPFACKAGKNGRVYSFEFIESNLKLCKKNLSLNPALKDRIEICEHPLSKKSGEVLLFKADSSCSHYVDNDKEDNVQSYTTISIDDFVEQKNISKVNFIKMDIEGSELSALEGAINTIKRDNPKLAISIYHKIEDLDYIPKLIKRCNPKYKFHIGYAGCSDSEYVLYCKVDDYEN